MFWFNTPPAPQEAATPGPVEEAKDEQQPYCAVCGLAGVLEELADNAGVYCTACGQAFRRL